MVLQPRAIIKPHVLLEAYQLSIALGDRHILSDISFSAFEGKVYGLFGPNGSGKTTLFNLLCGLHFPSSGWIRYYDELPAKVNPLCISKMKGGLARTFQVPVIVNDLSLIDNLLLAHRFHREGFLTLFYKGRSLQTKESQATSEILGYLDRFDLSDKANLKSGELSYGERRLVSILAAIFTGARILLLDEPFANLNVRIIEKLKNLFRTLIEAEQRMIMIIEHLPDNLVGFADTLLQLHGHGLDIHDVDDRDPMVLKKIIQSTACRYE